jgi:hypothetical protein
MFRCIYIYIHKSQHILQFRMNYICDVMQLIIEFVVYGLLRGCLVAPAKV